MQIACWEMPWVRALRAVALVLTVVLGLEWTAPVGGFAQPKTEPTSTPVASVANQDLPPMQEAEVIEERKPFYKKWWFWVIVVVVAAVGAAAAVIASDPPSPGLPGPQ